ncbi:MAG: hypothetical protein HY786_03135 [Deltaproteobacteria bacterium]|nr:hypothetical protein [Deltaproteobacteria bacterium]
MNKTLVQILSLFLLLLSTPAWASDGKAFVTYLEGTAFKSKDAREWSPISKGDDLAAGDSIKTGAGTRTELTLPDGGKSHAC